MYLVHYITVTVLYQYALECNERCETSSVRRVKLHHKRTKRLNKLQVLSTSVLSTLIYYGYGCSLHAFIKYILIHSVVNTDMQPLTLYPSTRTSRLPAVTCAVSALKREALILIVRIVLHTAI